MSAMLQWIYQVTIDPWDSSKRFPTTPNKVAGLMAVHGSVELQLVSSKEDRLPFTYWNFVDDHFVSYHFTKSMIFSNTKKQIKQTSVYICIYKHLPTCVSFFKHPQKKKTFKKKKRFPHPVVFPRFFMCFLGGKKPRHFVPSASPFAVSSPLQPLTWHHEPRFNGEKNPWWPNRLLGTMGTLMPLRSYWRGMGFGASLRFCKIAKVGP